MAVAARKKHKPSAGAADKGDFLKLFWTLAESDRAARTHAAARLLSHLRSNAADAADAVDASSTSADVQYTLKRLVRGLASSRDAARQGFSAALSGLLREFPALALADARALLRESMALSAAMRGMEQREHMFGRLFGLLALHRSGRLAADRALQAQVVLDLLELAGWKKWMREACFEGALAVLADVPAGVFAEHLAAPMAALLPSEDGKEWTADHVLLAAGVQHYVAAHGAELAGLELAPRFSVVRRKRLHVLAEPLRASAGVYPRVHSAWLGVFGHILRADAGPAAVVDGELFQEAWSVLVETALLGGGGADGTDATATAGTPSTHARRGLAFKLLELAAPRLPRPLLRSALTPRLVKSLYNNSVAKKTFLHEAARHCVKALAALAPAESVRFFARQLVSPMPTLLETAADGDEQQKLALERERQAALQRGGMDAIVAIEEEKERAEQRQKRVDSVRMWALDAIFSALGDSLARDEQRADEDEREDEDAGQPLDLDETLRFLVAHALFAPAAASTPNKKSKKKKTKKPASDLLAELGAPSPALSAAVVGYSKKRLFSLLGHGLSASADAADAAPSVLARVFAASQALAAEGTALRKPLGDERGDAALAAAVRELAASIASARLPSEKDARVRQQLEAFRLLLMTASVQLLDAEQRGEAVVVATDLLRCFSELLGGGKEGTTEGTKGTKEEDDDEGTDSIVVLTDMLLGLLSQDSSAMREIVTHVFRSLLPLLTAESLATMVAVLAPSADGEDAGGPEDHEDEDEDQEDQEEEDEVVLSTPEDVSEALRSDEALAALHREDLALAAIVGQVRHKAQRKKDARAARLQRLHFQLRVLDLLQLVAASESAAGSGAGTGSPRLVLGLARPLVEALAAVGARDSERRVLRDRLAAVLLLKVLRPRTAVAAALGEREDAAAAEALEALAAVVSLLAARPLDKQHAGKAAAAAVAFYVRVLSGHAELSAGTRDARLARVADVLGPAATDALTKKHARFPRAVLDELAASQPAAAARVLLGPLAAVAAASGEDEPKAADEFSRSEAFRLLALLLRPKALAGAAEAFADARAALAAAAARALREDAAPKKPKRLKRVLAFALQLAKAWRAAEAPAEGLRPLLRALEALETSSPVARSMARQAAAEAAAAVGADAADAADDKTQKTKKRKRA